LRLKYLSLLVPRKFSEAISRSNIKYHKPRPFIKGTTSDKTISPDEPLLRLRAGKKEGERTAYACQKNMLSEAISNKSSMKSSKRQPLEGVELTGGTKIAEKVERVCVCVCVCVCVYV
jgi:hypothetical protein